MFQPKNFFLPKPLTCLLLIIYACFFSSPVFALNEIFKQEAMQYRQLGYEAQKKGNLSAALNYYQKAVGIAPNYACVYNDMGIIFETQGRTKAAEEVYLKAASVDPGYAYTYTNLALLYEQKGDYLAAAKYWIRRAYSGSPDDPWVSKAQERINEIGKIIPEVKELYCARESINKRPSDAFTINSYSTDSADNIYEVR